MGTHDIRVSRRLYRIECGNLTVSELPPGGYRFGDAESFTVVRPGLEHSTFPEMLPQLVEFAGLIAPWVVVIAGPRLIAEDRRQILGRCHWHDGVVFINTRWNASKVFSTLFHELFHAVDIYLSPADHAVLDAAVARGPDFPSEYLCDSGERRARLFQNFASYLFEGGRVVLHAETPEILLLWRIYSGEVGAEIFEAMHSFDDIAAE